MRRPRLIQQHYRNTDGSYMTDLEAIQEARGRMIDAEMQLRSLIRQAQDDGRTWEEIGTALGVSRQAAWERWH